MPIIAMILFAYLGLYAADFNDPTFKINVSYNESNWDVVPNKSFRDRLTLRHLNLPATINVLAYRFAETITANGLVQKRIQSVYDGWQLIRQEPISDIDAKRKNVSKGIRSIYKKTYLDEELNRQTMLAGDICFVTDDTLAIVLNISVNDQDTLFDVKSDFNNLYTSFWLGDEKPVVYSVINNDAEWIMNNQNLSRKRLANTNFKLSDLKYSEPTLSVDAWRSHTGIQTYHNHNGDYLLMDGKVHILSDISDQNQTVDLKMNQPELILKNDGFYAIQKRPYLMIRTYENNALANQQLTLSYPASWVFSLNDHFLVISANKVELRGDNEIIWSYDVVQPIQEVVAHNDQLILAEDGGMLRVLDLNSGRLVHVVQALASDEDKFVDMVVNQSKLLLLTSNKGNVSKAIIDLANFKIEDTTTKEYRDFELVSVTKSLIIVRFKTNQGEPMLSALDFNTFATVWELPFNQYRHASVSDKLILAADKHNYLRSFKLATAKEVDWLNLPRLLHPEAPTKNALDVEVLGLIPSKETLYAVVKDMQDQKIVRLR